MNKAPAFLFYVDDFVGGTYYMTDSEIGTYLKLLLIQYAGNGEIPNDENLLRRKCSDFDKNWATIKDKFIILPNGNYQNVRLEAEMMKRTAYAESRSSNRKGRVSKKERKTSKSHEEDMKNISKSYEEHMGNGDVNVSYKYGETFENFRQTYPGTKRGFAVEFKNLKKHPDWKEVLPNLLKSINAEIADRVAREKGKKFVPEWAHLSTWLSQRRWEQEFEKEPAAHPAYDKKLEQLLVTHIEHRIELTPELIAYKQATGQ